MDKMKMRTPDITESNIEIIGQMFPNCLTESIREDGKVEKAIDFDQLRQELSKEIVEGPQERYQFTWPDKKKAIRLANAPTTLTLRPCREESVDFDNTQNLYIEGDNLEVLKVLRETYLGKVKMIYIDPPYNTGNDFVYEDDFSQAASEYVGNSGQTDNFGNRLVQNTENNGRFHTDWLNMIYPRLKTAKDLLTTDGIIIISIDDNEQVNLRKVCDEIFSPNNFIACIAWRRTDNQPNIGNLARVKEYLLIYSKTANCKLGRLPLTEKAKAEYRYSDEKGLFRRAILLDKTRGRRKYSVTTKLGTVLNGPWMVPEEVFKEMNQKGEIYWTESGDGQPYGKIYLSESKGQIANDFWGIEYGTNQRASLEVESLFGARYFDFPKPVSLLSNLLLLGTSGDSIVLDFFSGSGTTAHAVMKVNAEDGGNRKYIMVQLPEASDPKSDAFKKGYKNICEIGKERIRRAGRRILDEKNAQSSKDGLFAEAEENKPKLDIGFRVLKLDSSNMEDVYYKPEDSSESTLFEDNVKPDRSGEDLLFQVMLECNLPLSAKIQTEKIASKEVFSVNNGYLIACFDEEVNEEVITAVAKRKPYYFIMRDKSLSSDNVADNFEQIFQAYSKETIRRIL